MRLALPILFAVLAGCIDNPTTSSSASELTTSVPPPSDVTVALWTANRFPDFTDYVPTGATSIQELVTYGDPGGKLTDNLPTSYHWMIEDATKVFAVYRVGQDQEHNFEVNVNAAYNYADVYLGVTVDGGTGVTGGYGPTHPIGVNPHGDGDTYFSQNLVDSAVATANAVHTANIAWHAANAAE